MAVYDKKAKCFAQPFFTAHVDVGTRSFAAAAASSGTAVYHHPEDFALFLLGIFNDENGLFNLTAQPVHVAEAINLKKDSGVQPTLAS